MLRSVSIRCLAALDRAYRRVHALEPVGPLLVVGCRRYRGAPRRFDDGTVLYAGDWIGTLHLDNARLAGLGEGSGRHASGWRFARLMRQSLVALAEFSAMPAGARLKAFHGTTWMAPHGLKVGFSSEPLPDGLRRRLLSMHFGVLQHGFAPLAFRGERSSFEPRDFWITSAALRGHFGRASA